MIAILIIPLYILSVFLNRFLNKLLYKKGYSEIAPFIWFIPLIAICVFILVYLLNKELKSNWFTGKDW